MAPPVSILLPVHNGGNTLKECIESISLQSWEDFEVIAVDDGSTDSTPTLLKEWASIDRRVRPLTMERGGIVKALNFGLEACRGRFVARMDADDTMNPERLTLQMEHFGSKGDVDILGTLVTLWGDSPVSLGVKRYEEWTNSLVTHEEITSDIFRESPIVHPTFFLERKLYNELGGYRETPWPEDYDLLQRANGRGKRFGKVPRSLLCWRDSPTRLVRTDRRCSRDFMFRGKIHFLLERKPSLRDSGAVIVGTGSSGRKVAGALEEEGAFVFAFVDNKSGPPGRRVRGTRAYGFEGPIPAHFWGSLEGVPILLCIENSGGQDMIKESLEESILAQGHDYFVMI